MVSQYFSYQIFNDANFPTQHIGKFQEQNFREWVPAQIKF